MSIYAWWLLLSDRQAHFSIHACRCLCHWLRFTLAGIANSSSLLPTEVLLRPALHFAEVVPFRPFSVFSIIFRKVS